MQARQPTLRSGSSTGWDSCFAIRNTLKRTWGYIKKQPLCAGVRPCCCSGDKSEHGGSCTVCLFVSRNFELQEAKGPCHCIEAPPPREGFEVKTLPLSNCLHCLPEERPVRDARRGIVTCSCAALKNGRCPHSLAQSSFSENRVKSHHRKDSVKA